ncbi:MAG: hypothetical protein CVV14_08495 [Gammaproteobacteria bacterium HGW-Gammaproteobacteria-4]|jgi:hypothetical protein|nr:MAG: hypothetical protein CVV14_08495 [Gammaproteobacteria bacterium HGW-Gammaproteobacteria-4]
MTTKNRMGRVSHRQRFVSRTVLLCLALLASPTFAQPADTGVRLDVVVGELAASEPLIDPDFGVAARALGLRRTVEMWQWQMLPDPVPGAAGYQAQWSQQAIDSSAFDRAHRNPTMPFSTAQWWSDSAFLNGQPVSPTLLATLDGWQQQAVNVDALPENLAAIFRAEKGLLFSGSDSAQPQIGDLRIFWQTLPAGPVHGLAQVDGTVLAMAEGAGLLRGMGADAELPGLARGARPGSDLLWWLLAAVLLALALLVAVRRRARK